MVALRGGADDPGRAAERQEREEAREEDGGGVLAGAAAEPGGLPYVCLDQEFRYTHHMWEYHFMQGDWGGAARKPTTLGTNLYLEMPDPGVRGGLARGQGEEMDSKDLARWAPGMMREVAKALTMTVQDKTLAICKMSWSEHLENGHVPFRRGCAVCQRAAARMRPHYRQDCPEGYTLALDTAGPFCVGRDVDNKKKRYLLCGAYTWPTLGDVAEEDDLPQDVIPEKEMVLEDPEYMDYNSDEEIYAPSVAGDDDLPAGGDEAVETALGDEKCSPGADSRGSDEVTGEAEDSESPQRIDRKGSDSAGKKSSSEEDSGGEKLTDEELGRRALDRLLEESPPMDGPSRAIPSTPSDDITGDEKELPARLDLPLVDRDGNPLPGLWGDPGPTLEPVEKKKKPKEEKIFKTRTIMQCVPMKSKKAEDVLAAIEELYMRFRRYGYPIFRLHTDSGKEFVNSKVKDWAVNRGLLHTRSAPDEHQSNGRAEAAVSSIKSRVRRLLHSSAMGTDLWPLAARHVVELERRRFEKAVGKMPRFGERVVIRRRGWKTMFEDDFEPRGEEVTYMTPMAEVSKGHCVMTDAGKLQVVSTVWNDLSEKVIEEKREWVGEEVDPESDDPVVVRRRLREKTAMAAMTLPEADNLEKQIQLCRVLHEEEENMKGDDPSNLAAVQAGAVPMRNEQIARAVREEEDEVLQTRIVGNSEVVREPEKWKDAINKELNENLMGKAIHRLSPEEVKELTNTFDGRVEIVPGKAIHSIKAPDGRRKCRIVVCGNYLGEDGLPADPTAKKKRDPAYYASGADVTALRVALAEASTHEWHCATLDVKAAFLNADLEEGAKKRDEKRVVLVQPPKIIVKLGFAVEGEMWQVDRALYGLRESPRCWGNHRDAGIRTIKTEYEIPLGDGVMKKSRVLRQCDTEENIWRIEEIYEDHEGKPTGTNMILGLLLVYVDDFLMLGNRDTVQWLARKVEDMWEITPVEWANPCQGLRYCGTEILRLTNGSFHINQQAYIRELVKRHELEGETMSSPIRDFMEPEDEENVTPEEVKKAQQLAGELQWVSSRTRPDVSYAVAKIGGWALRAPRWASKMALNVVRYLGGTVSTGIHYDSRQETNEMGWLQRQIEVYTDASFAPGGTVSHHCCILMWAGSPLAWTSTRQPFPALSMAEAELIAMLEGLVLGESVGCLVEELADYQQKTLYCDNTAAVALATAKGGSWRTRHLKVRAAHLRYKTETEEWKVRHKAGQDMVADIGTKALRGDRMSYLNELMKVMPAPRTAGVSAQALADAEEAEQRHANYLRAVTAVPTTYQRWFAEDLEKVTKLVALIELFQKIQTVAAGNDSLGEPETEGGESFLAMLSAVMIVVGMILVKVLEKMWNYVNRPQPRVAQLRVLAPVREEPVVVDEYEQGIEAAGLRSRRGRRGGAGRADGEVRGTPPPGGLAAARGRPGGVEASRMTEEELFAAADAMSGIAEEDSPQLGNDSDESMQLENELETETEQPANAGEGQVTTQPKTLPRGPRWRDSIPDLVDPRRSSGCWRISWRSRSRRSRPRRLSRGAGGT